jgi:hypothetical protein
MVLADLRSKVPNEIFNVENKDDGEDGQEIPEEVVESI